MTIASWRPTWAMYTRRPIPLEPQGFLEFMQELHKAGVSVAAINLMSKTNPAFALGLPVTQEKE
jgi:hypothetical protein